eukprot:6177997-Pleurochrysis_carterae.AAC.6
MFVVSTLKAAVAAALPSRFLRKELHVMRASACISASGDGKRASCGARMLRFCTLRLERRIAAALDVCCRSYGSDGAAVSDALRAWAEGAHPTVRGVTSLAPCASASWRAEYADDGSFTLRPQASDGGVVEAGRVLSESAAVTMMEVRHVHFYRLPQQATWSGSPSFSAK